MRKLCSAKSKKVNSIDNKENLKTSILFMILVMIMATLLLGRYLILLPVLILVDSLLGLAIFFMVLEYTR